MPLDTEVRAQPAQGEKAKRFPPYELKDSALKSKKLSIVKCKLVAAPAYVAARKKPRRPVAELLPGWQVEALGVYAVWPPNVAKESLTFRLLRFLEAQERKR